MSAQRRYWSRNELALRAPRPLWWPAVSISFLCLFTLFAPAGFITGMNLYLLLLAGIGWLATRQPIDGTLVRALAPFVAAIVLGLVAGLGAERYLYLKDAWYYSNPAVVIAVGFVLGRLLNDVNRGLRAFVIGGTLVALFHLMSFVLHPELLMRQATQIRALTGTGYYATSLVVILLVGWWGRWRSALGLSPSFASLSLLLCSASTVLSFSRTMAMVVVLGVLAMAGFFARREWLRIGLFVAVLALGLAALQASVDTSSVQAKRSFIGKLARSADELSVQDYSNRLDINTNWRGYETSRALDSWKQAGVARQIFGQGFGAQVDLGLFQNLSTDSRSAVRFIPIFHNGYAYLLVKTGLVGVLLYLGALLWMYRVARRTAAGDPNDPATLRGRALQGCVVVLAVSTWVVAGAFNKFDMFSFLMLIGFLLAARARESH
jgi:O-antigen ligase